MPNNSNYRVKYIFCLVERIQSDDFIIPDNFFDDFQMNNVIEPPRSPERREEKRSSSDSTSSLKNFNIKKNQTSLLETGFSRLKSRKNNDSIGLISPLQRNNSSELARSKQPKMTNFVRNRSFTEPDSTTQNRHVDEPLPPLSLTIPTSTSNPVPSVGDLMVFVDVKIDGMVFRIPVLLSQVQSNTIGWLAEQASHKYSR